MTSEERENLRRLAQAATPGPWNTNGRNEVGANDGRLIAICFGRDSHTEPAAFLNADYIAAAHPGAVLALLDALDAAEVLAATADVTRAAQPAREEGE